MRNLSFFLFIFFFFFTLPVFSQFEEDGGTLPTYLPKDRDDIPGLEKSLNFGTVYITQWTFYLLTQKEEIKKHGSWHKWKENPWGPRFDHDSFEYNIFKHTLVGNYYYLWYRSREYSEKEAFMWTFISSLAFEFTIETFTERPSYQDIYQTPVFGMVLGIGSEKLSLYCHSWNTWYGDTLGYLINPMTLIPQFTRKKISASALIRPDKVGALITMGF